MKQITAIFLLLLFCKVNGQKWHLDRIDKSSKFKYEYWFQFENKDDSCSYTFKKNAGKSISTIQISDNSGDTVVLATIRINDLDNDTLFITITDVNGLGKLMLKPGKYSLEILAPSYDKFTFDFKIEEEEFFNLNVKLGLAPELTVYQINSKTELNEGEILKIMKCVKENRHENYKNCSDQKKYYVTMHI